MTKRLSRLIVLFGSLTIVTMGLYAPWIATLKIEGPLTITGRIEDLPENPEQARKQTRADAEVKTTKGHSTTVVKDAGYHLIFESPGRDIDNAYRLFNIESGVNTEDNRYMRENVAYTVNISRLVVQCVIVALFWLGLLWVIKAGPRSPSTQD